MYFPFFVLHDWGKKSAEARSPHCAVLPLIFGNFKWIIPSFFPSRKHLEKNYPLPQKILLFSTVCGKIGLQENPWRDEKWQDAVAIVIVKWKA